MRFSDFALVHDPHGFPFAPLYLARTYHFDVAIDTQGALYFEGQAFFKLDEMVRVSINVSRSFDQHVELIHIG